MLSVVLSRTELNGIPAGKLFATKQYRKKKLKEKRYVMFSAKKIAAFLLAAIMVAGLAACNNDTEGSGDVTPTPTPVAGDDTTPTPTDAVDADPADIPGTYEHGLSKFDPPVTATYAREAALEFVFGPGQSYENNVWMTEYKDVLGIDLQTVWTAEGIDAYNEKLQLIIMSQDIPDIFSVNLVQLQSLVAADMVADLTTYAEDWTIPLVRENLQADDGMALEYNTFGDKLYALPAASGGAGGGEYLYIRSDWREKVGLPRPKTMDDLYNLAKAFKEQDPDDNGADDTFGFGLSNRVLGETWYDMKAFANGYGAYPNIWVEKNGGIEHGIIQPEMKTALEALKKFYDDGLIDREFVTKGSGAVSDDALAGRVGLAYAEWWMLGWPLPDGMKAGQEWEFAEIPYAPGTPGTPGGRAIAGGGYVVRKGFEHPEAMVKMYNLFQDRVMSQNFDTTIYKGPDDNSYNIEGTTAIYTVIGPNRNMTNHKVITAAIDVYLADGIDAVDTSEFNTDQRKVWEDTLGYFEKKDIGFADDDERVHHRMAYLSYYGPDSTWGVQDARTKSGFMLDAFYGVNTPAMISYQAQLESNAEEMIVNIISGAAPLDSFDQFVTDWKALGGDEMTAEANEWWQSVQ